MILECLKDIVGLKGACKSSTGIHINGLPGVSLKKFAVLADEEKVRGENLFYELRDESIIELKNKIESKLDFNFKYITDHQTRGSIGEYFKEQVQRGFEVSRWNQDIYQSIKIETISFKSDMAGTFKLWIENECCETEEREIKVKCGNNTIRLDYESTNDFIIKLDPCLYIADTGCGCTNYCGCDLACDCGCFYVRMVEFHESGYTYEGSGIQVRASCRCCLDDIFCEFKTELALPLRMMIGIKLMEEAKVSDGIHPLVRNGKEDAEYLLTRWYGGTDMREGMEIKGELKKLIDPVIDKMNNYLSHQDSPCIGCQTPVQVINKIP